jgi:hypothetical protein
VIDAPHNAQDALLQALAAEIAPERHGNLARGRGRLDGRAVRIALVDNRFASGAIGSAEAERLVALLRVAATEKSPVVLYLDSAGAKVSEGLKALGAFRALFRAGLDAALAGAPLAVVLGRNCYGGSSMLAHLAPQRLFSPGTQLAMSGPAILASTAGMSPMDEMFRAMAEAALAPDARAKSSGANRVWSPGMQVGAWLREALAARGDAITSMRFRHEALEARFGKRPPDPPWEAVRRRDLEKIYARCEARESQGLLAGQGQREGADEPFLGLVGKQPLGAARAWRFAAAVWQHVERPPARLEVFLDCATHAPRLEDERLVLTEYIVDMAFALASLGARGTRVGLTVLGQAGGGVYVALAAPAHRVASVYGAEIQVLPGAAVAAILGTSQESVPGFAEYRESGVADEEIKLGIVD